MAHNHFSPPTPHSLHLSDGIPWDFSWSQIRDVKLGPDSSDYEPKIPEPWLALALRILSANCHKVCNEAFFFLKQCCFYLVLKCTHLLNFSENTRSQAGGVVMQASTGGWGELGSASWGTTANSLQKCGPSHLHLPRVQQGGCQVLAAP